MLLYHPLVLVFLATFVFVENLYDAACGQVSWSNPLDRLQTSFIRYHLTNYHLSHDFSESQLELVLPSNIHRSFVNHFGDHIDWKKLESYSITAEFEDEVYEIAARDHEGFPVSAIHIPGIYSQQPGI